MRSYNLFRSNENDGFCCAVPEDRSVPHFVIKPLWVFEGKVDPARKLPLGFDREAAVTGVRFNGFYLYSNFRDGEPFPDEEAFPDETFRDGESRPALAEPTPG